VIEVGKVNLLLVSDTHGDVERINRLARSQSVDVVVHAGDFGFYDRESAGRLSNKELRLQIVHSDLCHDDKVSLLDGSVEDQRVFVQRLFERGDFCQLLAGEMELEAPVYAVWGNHEDVEVVKRLATGEYMVPNLHLLDDRSWYEIDDVQVFGLGGNILPGKKLYQEPIAGGGGRVWSVLEQFERLVAKMEEVGKEGRVRILVSHLSSGREPLATLLGAVGGADLVVSGHMGAPLVSVWNEFGVRGLEEVRERLQTGIQALEREGQEEGSGFFPALYQKALPAEVEPDWYKGMWNVNLPDAKVGAALLTASQGKWELQNLES